ncbi:P-loop containing nucleoside triphosphate hydrolase protein [Fomitiporia mediterranea MF3/22]|uniref:p-loop containing nucleoside triphosphate hydrolase protein n=1 Tax=Fomitiporia mediterranea (strain MF3/22) TaxID=694068 RepID=R7SJJ4_FOMME|nr:P-loop containing nucleoside triphosphate hydrolase protein [Fomitiporia mediterranea MF3/22]EJC97739.1 P-loop containing nucleoside triphosphate hydrolase protein [Fomitiporia mediterranea MF3/22]
MEVLTSRIWSRGLLLYLPPVFALVSLVYILQKYVRVRWSREKGKEALLQEEDEECVRSADSLLETVRKFDGPAILLFRLLRLLTVLALLSIEVYELSTGHGFRAQALQIPLFIYASLLSMLSMATSTQWRDTASLQLAFVLFMDFFVYFVLDVWPCAELRPKPFDPADEPTTWVRVALLTLGGVIIPLVMPRPFRPSSPDDEPSSAETASLFSRYTYLYLDRVVWYAFRVPDITVKDMPEMPGPGKIEQLSKRALAAVDPVQVGKRHIIWGILNVWRSSFVLMTVFQCLWSLAKFSTPYGMRNLLASMETGIPSHGLHIWVWILVLVVGPVLSGFLYNQWLFESTRIQVENASVFTYLVFHHALRIRLKSDSPDSDTEKGSSKDIPETTEDSTQTTDTPATTDGDSSTEEASDIAPASSTTAASNSSSQQDTKEKNSQERTGHIVGKINNLITSDLIAVADLQYLTLLPGILVQLVVSIVFLYDLLGWSAFVALVVMIICLPLPALIGKSMVAVQKRKMQATDKRVQSVTEAMGVIRMIKLFGWEPYMLKQLSDRRDEELTRVRRFKLLSLAMNASNGLLPLLSNLAAISTYTLVSKGELSASRIFAALLIFNMLEQQLWTIMSVIPGLLKSKASCDRYTHFLNSTELLCEGNAVYTSTGERISSEDIEREQPGSDVIGFKQCAFSWDTPKTKESGTPRKHHTRKHFSLRFDDEVTFKPGQINLIVGPTAAGKTSVLLALLGEMYCKPHGVGSWYKLPRDGGIAYAPQESWVLNATIRDNILFGEPYDEDRYKKVINQCALERDLALWEAGDLTEVGEKGLTLSGGQKARVTLARAVYSSASILLLDDVLAALDVHTAKWIVDKALQGDLIQGRTVLLVTHNISLAGPIAGYVVVLTRHGTVSAQGTVSEVLKKDSRLRAEAEKEREAVEQEIESEVDEAIKDKDADAEDSKKTAGKLVVAEEKAMGRVELAAIMLYVSSMGGAFVWIVIIGSLILAMVIMVMQQWFVGYWSNQYETRPASEVPVFRYLLIYALANVLRYAADFGSQFLWLFRSLRASKIIHSQLLQSIFTSSFRWLDVTPVGRIIARCTQDMSSIDDQLSAFSRMFLRVTFNMICYYFAAVYMAGWSAFISGLVIGVLATSLGRIYLKCQMCTRREMSNAKAPVLSQVGTALSGLPSIRAYGAQDLFYSELKKRIDVLARSSYCFYDINRWVSIRMDFLGAIFGGVVAAYLAYGSKIPAGYAGFTLSSVLSFSSQILFWVRIYNLAEIQANSLERMLEFMRIDHEPAPIESGKPPAYWPSSGELRVEKLFARYSDDAPAILKNISFNVKSGERVGIVGRTGAGKSSIALALLRAIKTEGKVYYDGLATDEINLDSLRTNITLIPQQPELIHGTLRENLDPFGQHDDATLYDALNAAGFFNIKDLASQKPSSDPVNDMTGEQCVDGSEPSAKIGLDTRVESGGTNFSLGQRQIIALARAIVRRSKLLILDEATAAIDYDTDTAIQNTLRTEFSKDTTLLTIAHRLQTIVDYDKIMVLDAGELVEFDSPNALLEKEDGYFRALVDESDDRDLLRNLAGQQ